MEYILIFIAAVFVNNVVLSQFLYMSVPRRIQESGYSNRHGSSRCICAYHCDTRDFPRTKICAGCIRPGLYADHQLHPIIAALVQMVEIILKKVSPALYQALGVFLPLITTNCCVLGVAIQVIQKQYNLLESVVYAFSIAIGFALA